MGCPVGLFGAAERPFGAANCSPGEVLDVLDKAFDIDNRMATENLGQPLSQVAGQAMAGALQQTEIKEELAGGYAAIGQLDIVGTFTGISEEGVEELIGALLRKKLLEGLGGE